MRFLKRERTPHQSVPLRALKYYGAWALTALALIPMLIRLKALALVSAWRVINNDALRPPGWNSSTLVAVDKCTTFLALGAWLMGVLLVEGYLQEALAEGRLLARAGRMLLVIGGIYAAAEVLLWLIG